ncbi:MAG: hypothetical protein C5S49_02845 [Candidatus Methanogaster sp.]|nr:MAG: hypothetical protein C5S49_02845 [ANME-2 cluster archaeon]
MRSSHDQKIPIFGDALQFGEELEGYGKLGEDHDLNVVWEFGDDAAYPFQIHIEIATDPVTVTVVDELDLKLDESRQYLIVVDQALFGQGYGLNRHALALDINDVSEREGCVLCDWFLSRDLQISLAIDGIMRHA